MNGAPVIHIVDDDASFRTAISRLLSASGYEVADYESAGSFLRRVENTKPGCILLDLQMPDLSGLQLQEELAKLQDGLADHLHDGSWGYSHHRAGHEGRRR